MGSRARVLCTFTRLFGPQFSHLWNGNNNRNCITVLLLGLSQLIHMKNVAHCGHSVSAVLVLMARTHTILICGNYPKISSATLACPCIAEGLIQFTSSYPTLITESWSRKTSHRTEFCSNIFAIPVVQAWKYPLLLIFSQTLTHHRSLCTVRA